MKNKSLEGLETIIFALGLYAIWFILCYEVTRCVATVITFMGEY